MNNEFKIMLQAVFDKVKSLANLKSDLKIIESKLPKVKIQGTLDERKTKKELSVKLKNTSVKIKVDADTSLVEKKIQKLSSNNKGVTITPRLDNTRLVSDLRNTEKTTTSFFDKFTSNIAGLNVFRIAIQKVSEAIREALQNVKELDQIKTDIQMASGVSNVEANNMMKSYNQLGKNLSSTTKNVAKSANEFIRMGESISNTNELIQNSQVLSQIGMIDSADSASYLISGMKGYKIAAEDSIDITDKLTSVDMSAAVSAGGLAEALSKCSNIANSSGTSIDRLIGYMAIVGETTQKSMSEVGNSFQSIYSRMNNIKIGKFVDDETGESLSDTEKVLNKLGIQLRDTADTYRDYDDVLDDVGKNWSSFTQVEQNAISVAVAGTRQRENFTALMNRYSSALEYAEIAANSAGTALKRYEQYQDSIGAKSNELTNALESISLNTVSEDMYKTILEATTGIVEFTDKTNILKGTLAGLVTYGSAKFFTSMAVGMISAAKSTAQLTSVMAMFNQWTSIRNLKEIGVACIGLSDKQLKLVLSTKGLTNAQRLTILQGKGVEESQRQQTLTTLGFAEAENIATGATFSFAGALNAVKTAFAANPIGMSIMLITTAVSVATMTYTHFKQKEEELIRTTQDAAQAYSESAKSINDYADKYSVLHKELTNVNTTEERQRAIKEELLSLQQELNDKYGDEYGKLNLVTDAYKNQSDAIRAYNKEVANNYLTENRSGIAKADQEMNKPRDYNIGSTGNINDEYAQDIYEIASKYQDKGIALNKFNGNDIQGYSIRFTGDASEADQVIHDLAAEIKGLEDTYKDNNFIQSILDNSENMLKRNKDILDNYQSQYTEALMAQITTNDTLSSGYNQAMNAVKAYNEAVIASDETKILSARDNLNEVKGSIDITSDTWKMFGSIITDIFAQADTSIYDFRDALSVNANELMTFAQDLEGLSKTDLLAMENDGKTDNFDKLIEGASKYGLSIDTVIDELIRLGIVKADVENVKMSAESFAWTDDLNKRIDDVQSKVQTLNSALESLNTGKMDTSLVLDLLQQFPQLNSYVDMSKENFGNLKQGLEEVIRTQPTALIDSLKQLEATSDEDRTAINNLISSFEELSNITVDFSSFDNMADGLNGVENAASTLISAMDKLKEGTALTKGEMANLALQYPELLTASNLFTDGSAKGQQEMLNNVLGMYEQQYDSIIDVKIAELKATNQCLEDQITLEAQKMNKVLEIEALQDTGKLETEQIYQTKLNELRDLDGQNFVTFQDGKLKVNSDALTKQLEQENEKGVQAEPIWQAQQELITGAYAKGGEGGLIALNALGGRINTWVGNVGARFRGLALTIASALAGKQVEDTKGIGNVNTSLSSGSPLKTTYNSKGNLKIGDKSVDDWVASYTENNNAIVESLEKTIESNNTAIDNLSSMKGLSLPEITSKGNSGGKGGSGDKGGSKDKEESKKEIDWIERRNEHLAKLHEDLKAAMDDETKSYNDQIAKSGQLIEIDKERLEFSKDSLAYVNKQWDETKSKFSNEELARITTGDVENVEYDAAKAEEYQNAIDLYKKKQEYEERVKDVTDEVNEHLREEIELRKSIIQAQQDEITGEMNIAQSRIDLIEAKGGVVTERMLKNQIGLNRDMMETYRDKIDKLWDEADLLDDTDSAEYYSIMAQIDNCENSIIQCKIKQEEWNDQIKRLPIERIQKYINMLQNIKQDTQNFLDEQNVLGIKNTAEQFQQLIGISKEEATTLLKQQTKLKELLSTYEYGSEKFNDVSNEIQDIDNSISGLIQNQYEWNKAILQIPVDNISKFNDKLSQASNVLADVISDQESALSAVTGTIDKEIDALNDLKEVAENNAEAQTRPLQNQLGLLQKQNTQYIIQKKLEQSIFDLERAKSQKNNKVMREGEFVYEADADAIRNAQSANQDAQFDKTIHDIQKQIDSINDAKDELIKGYDEQIERLDKIKDKWSSIASDIQLAMDQLKANEQLGNGWNDKVLSGNDSDIYDAFKGIYENAQNQKTQIDDQIKSNERIAEMMTQFAEQYQSGAITYEQAMAGISNLTNSMKDGYSALEQLGGLLSLENVGSMAELSSKVQQEVSSSVGMLSQYMGTVKENSDAIAEYTKTWDEMKNNIAEQVEALKKAAEALEKAAGKSSGSHSSSGGGSGLSSNKPNTNDNSYVASGPGHSDAAKQEAIDRGDKIIEKNTYHDGIEKGAIGVQGDSEHVDILKALAERDWGSDEFPIVAKRGELVLNESQQARLLNNFSMAQILPPEITMPDYGNSNSYSAKTTTQNIECNFGDIKLTDVRDVDGFAKAFSRQLRPLMLQELGKRKY